ncbi:MAG TPA: VOC family protein [Rudaea sp.]
MRLKRFVAVLALSILPALAGAETKAATNNTVNDHAGEKAMTRVTGIGGVFLKATDPVALRAWYKTHLGIDVQTWGGAKFRWTDSAGHPVAGSTAWMIGDGKNFAPSTASVMVNYRVADLHALLAALRAEGCTVLDKTDESEYGKFGWVMDPEGNKIELWQPPEGK